VLAFFSIRANQHVESLQGQTRFMAQQRDDLQLKLSAAEDQIHHHLAALCNLQIVLEQFQKGERVHYTYHCEFNISWNIITVKVGLRETRFMLMYRINHTKVLILT
jgi:hypothetical protein